MSRAIGMFLLFAAMLPSYVFGQAEASRPARILFLVDASSSMSNEWIGKESRFQAASRVINTLVDSIHRVNTDVAFAVRVFGNQYPSQDKNCYDTKLEVPFNLGNDAQIKARLSYLKPLGYSPIAWSLKETAEKDFTESSNYSYSIILITDGGESCGGDICATVTALLEKKISFKPYILSLIDYEPLRLQYECLGKYLTVAREKDIEPVIKTIINDNRKILTIKSSGLKTIATTSKPVGTTISKPIMPEVKPELVVVKKEAPKPIIKKEEPKPIIKPELAVVKKEEPKPVIKKEEPKPVVKPEPVVVKKEEPKPVVVEPPVVRPKLKSLDRIASLTKPRKMNLLYTLADGNPVSVPKLKDIVVIKDPAPGSLPGMVAQPTTVASAPKPKPGIVEPTTRMPKVPSSNSVVTKTENPKPSKLDFVKKTEEAKETNLQIYFTDGKGKFYKTEPRIRLKDNKTGNLKELYRNMSGGEPTPIKLTAGNYDLEIPGSKSSASGIVIEEGKSNKYYLKVTGGSLSFYYPTAPDRAAKEYNALVSKRFEPGPVVKQKCDTELPYDPANYHIEINTLPPLTYNVDLEFGRLTKLAIPEPGEIAIANTDRIGKIQFWWQHGDTYEPFYEMTVDGNPAVQKATFLPGTYQVRFYSGPVTALAKADIILFKVKSNMTTTIKLEK